jgi:uncharacterized protein YndB with AHSA1/START domain
MARIVFEINIDAGPKQVLDALHTQAGIAGWWTEETDFAGEVGSVMTVGFPDRAPLPFELRAEQASEQGVVWVPVGQFPPHWVGTRIAWTLTPADGGTLVHFDHAGWPSDTGPFPSSALTWGQLMTSLKSYVETGTGTPLYRKG